MDVDTDFVHDPLSPAAAFAFLLVFVVWYAFFMVVAWAWGKLFPSDAPIKEPITPRAKADAFHVD